ncbi:hypothetical protein AOLI_G00282350 [Acnodon oligacanthus]
MSSSSKQPRDPVPHDAAFSLELLVLSLAGFEGLGWAHLPVSACVSRAAPPAACSCECAEVLRSPCRDSPASFTAAIKFHTKTVSLFRDRLDRDEDGAPLGVAEQLLQ